MEYSPLYQAYVATFKVSIQWTSFTWTPASWIFQLRNWNALTIWSPVTALKSTILSGLWPWLNTEGLCLCLVKLYIFYMVRVPMSVFPQTFLEAVWPIGVVRNGSLITVEITDSTVCPHYDRQKLKCIKHSNPSSCRWKAGTRRVQRQWLPAA